MNITFYKVLDEDGRSMHGGNCLWSLPTAESPGKWMSAIKPIICGQGYHLCRGAKHLIHWFGPVIWGVEARGEIIEADDKIVVEQARLVARVSTWNERTARLFAADCAGHVLPLFEHEYPDDNRPRKAIEATRAFARDEITAGAADAAAVAVRSVIYANFAFEPITYAAGAAQSAADSAAAAARSWADVDTAAWAAAVDARCATKFAAHNAEDNNEYKWQIERLTQYLRGEVG